MKDMVYDPNDEPKIAIAKAVMEVANRHHELNAAIGHGVRRVLARRGDSNPDNTMLKLDMILSEARHDWDNLKYNKAKVLFIDGLLETKHQLRPDLTRYIMDQVRDNALADDDDHEAATGVAYEVFSMAGNGMRHLSEQQEVNRRKQAKDRAEREARHLEAARKRVKNRRLRAG